MMISNFEFWDYLVFITYVIMILGGWFMGFKRKKGHQKKAEDYFLASKSLPWWNWGVINCSKHIGRAVYGDVRFRICVGTGNRFLWIFGIHYLINSGKILFAPFHRKRIIYHSRIYGTAIFHQFKNYFGRILDRDLYVCKLDFGFISGVFGLGNYNGIPMICGVISIALFASAYSLYGGLKTVAWTDVIQVIFFSFWWICYILPFIGWFPVRTDL